MGVNYQSIKTKDGSFTLDSPLFDECYHSVHDGALNETMQKHVIPAFAYTDKKELAILDICFGLGFNTFATISYLTQQYADKKIRIYAPEFDKNLLASLHQFTYPKAFDEIAGIIKTVLSDHYYKDDRIEMTLMVGEARQRIRDLRGIDIIYQDAFSPKKNPLLWTREYFTHLYAISSEDAVMTTYSVATPVRLGMHEAGFYVYEYKSAHTRSQTIAAKKALPLPRVDMAKKLRNNPAAACLRDADLQ